MEYYLGIDIGTSSVKAVAYNPEGRPVANYSVNYPMIHPQPGFSEQDPERIFSSVMKAVKKILNELANAPRLVSFSTAMHSLILMDKRGVPLGNCIIWADNRAADIAGSLRNSEWGNYCYQNTGVPVHPMSPFCKMLWLRDNDPALWQRAAQFVGIREYVLYRLFGIYCCDLSIGSATGLMNLRTGQWDEKILEKLGIRNDQLPRLVSPMEIISAPLRKEISDQLPSLAGSRFIVGASDGALANIGSGALSPDILAVTIGTSSAARLMLKEPYIDPQQRSFCYLVRPNAFLVGGASNNGAVVLDWLKNQILKSRSGFERLIEEAATVPAGSSGLVFVPYLLGERAPWWDPRAEGTWSGVRIDHKRPHFLRSALEGILFCVYSFGRVLTGLRSSHEIRASGGFTRNDFWVQMLSDLFDLPVKVSDVEDSSAWGAVLLGIEALGLRVPDISGSSRCFIPDPANHAVYRKQFEKFERISQLSRELDGKSQEIFS